MKRLKGSWVAEIDDGWNLDKLGGERRASEKNFGTMSGFAYALLKVQGL